MPGKAMSRDTLMVWAGRALFLGLWMGVWEWIARTELLPPAFIGMPSKFIRQFWISLWDGSYLESTIVTMQATLAAFVIGAVAALLVAMVMSASPIIGKILSPFVDAFNSLPRVALIPLFIIWFGLGMTQKVASGVSIMFFIVLSYTIAGAKSVDPDHVVLARSLGIPRWKIFTTIVIPTAVPAIFSGLRLGMIYTILGVITAEMLAGGEGLGTRVSYYSNIFDTNGVLAVLIVLVLLASAVSYVMSVIENWIGRWRSI